MATQFFDLDINAKLPIIKAESNDNPLLNGTDECNNHHSHQNGLTNHHEGNDYHDNNHTKDNNQSQLFNNCSGNNINSNHDHLSLPKPSFRLTSYCVYKRRNHTLANKRRESGNAYYRYEEPSAEELLETVEYDLDEQDSEWLKIFNQKFSQKTGYQLSESDFERVMDRLEKESYFDKSSDRDVDEDAVCAICNDGECSNANVILFCDMCNLPVHQECYGVPYIPEGSWLCRRCLQSPSCNVRCVLCPNLGGAFKQTDDNKWAHVICALWIPEVCFANTVFLEPIDSIDQIPQARWKLTCYICKQKKNGACIQCHKPNCYAPFHVTCAQQAGLYMKISTCRYPSADGGTMVDVKKEAFCDVHQPRDGSYGAAMYSGDETDEEEIDTYAYKKRKQEQRDRLKKTRKILAEKRETSFNPIVEPKVDSDKLLEISALLRRPKKKMVNFDSLRAEITQNIAGYWSEKRSTRKGVPLLRRLQVSYNNTIAKQVEPLDEREKDRYTKLRYDLEKARLLVGEVKKRELLKKRLFKLSQTIVEKKFSVIDYENPPTEE